MLVNSIKTESRPVANVKAERYSSQMENLHVSLDLDHLPRTPKKNKRLTTPVKLPNLRTSASKSLKRNQSRSPKNKSPLPPGAFEKAMTSGQQSVQPMMSIQKKLNFSRAFRTPMAAPGI